MGLPEIIWTGKGVASACGSRVRSSSCLHWASASIYSGRGNVPVPTDYLATRLETDRDPPELPASLKLFGEDLETLLGPIRPRVRDASWLVWPSEF